MPRILNVSFYRFVRLPHPEAMQKDLKQMSEKWGVKGTLLLSPEGINGMLAAPEEPLRAFLKEFFEEPLFSGMPVKESYSEFVPFQRIFVKIKKEIIPVGDATVCPEEGTAPALPPRQLKEWLDEGRDFTLLDTRNDYEIQHGTFQKATHLGIQHFRDLRQKMAQIPPEQRQKPLVMFCTGGIRCEKASILARQEGFEEVYQLQDGILRYFEECGGDHYQGNCFVFDERVALNPEMKPISKE